MARTLEITDMADQLQQWKELAAQLRVDSIRCTTAAGSGHPTSSMSAADLMAVLLTKYLRFDWSKPHATYNDRFVLSKGHACPVLYSMYKAAGVITDAELLTLRKFGSRLEGHPNPHVLPYVDVATGSLGQGLPIAVGMGINGKYLDKIPYRIFVLLGDSEMAEGSVWEGLDKASTYKLNNVIAILDMNRLGQRGQTELGWNSAAYAARARGFGWHAIELDGHDFTAIDKAFTEAIAPREQPAILIAKTKKGKGVALVEDKEGWHGKALSPEQAREAIKELGGERNQTYATPKPEVKTPAPRPPARPLQLPKYEVGNKEATRKAYGDAITALGAAHPEMVALDGEVSNSTHSDEFKKAYPDRFFEMYIAEQQMVSAAVGLAVLGKQAFASTFAAFLTRAYDQVRMAAISNATVKLSGSHAGVSIGEDGPSQMALEDLAMFRAVGGSTVLYPADANQTTDLLRQMVDLKGISYIRTTREKTPIIYAAGEKFPVGGSRVVKQSDKDRATVIGAGVTLHEALKAHDSLKKEGIAIRVIDLYSVKPIDREGLRKAARETGGKLIVVEDHWPEGGLGDAVLDAFVGETIQGLKVVKLAVPKIPGSGTPAELLHAAGIDADAIIKAVRSFGG
jgi:transketolase